MLSEVTYVISDASETGYAFTFDWVRASHIHCSLNDVELVPGDDFTISGDSGAATLTLVDPVALGVEVLDDLRIWKETPQTFADRTVDFAAGGVVSEDSLDDAIKHGIALSQDLSDELDTALKYNTDGEFDGGSKKLINLLQGRTLRMPLPLGRLPPSLSMLVVFPALLTTLTEVSWWSTVGLGMYRLRLPLGHPLGLVLLRWLTLVTALERLGPTRTQRHSFCKS